MKHRKIALCGLLTALALALSLLERWIPIGFFVPVPGIKLGLANIVTIFALLSISPQAAAAILFCRVTLGSVFAGSVTSFLFGLFGGLLALLVMFFLLPLKDKYVSIYGISVVGAAMHGIGQILAAVFVLKSMDVLSYLPLLLISAIPMGILTAFISELILRYLSKTAIYRQ